MASHGPTEHACRHIVHGNEGEEQRRVVELLIQGNGEASNGVHLLYIFDDGNGADTWHMTVEDALKSAELEYQVKPSEWTILS